MSLWLCLPAEGQKRSSQVNMHDAHFTLSLAAYDAIKCLRSVCRNLEEECEVFVGLHACQWVMSVGEMLFAGGGLYCAKGSRALLLGGQTPDRLNVQQLLD